VTPAPMQTTTTGYHRIWLVVFGAFLGLCLLKFGNPVILARQLPPPQSWDELWNHPWPPSWSWTGLLLLTALALPLLTCRLRWRRMPLPPLLWIPAIGWFTWQAVAHASTVDATLGGMTLAQFTGVLACYFVGAALVSDASALRWVLIGLIAALCICLMRAATQRWVEFPADHALLVEGQRTGWTNFPPAIVETMRREGTIVNTNGVDIANPMILLKLERGRVHGTLVYPNALAGAVLLLLPLSLVTISAVTQDQRTSIRVAALGTLLFLGLGGLVWSGSKSGWLIALGMVAVGLLRFPWGRRWARIAIPVVLALGLVSFGLRFERYFRQGATSVGARMDYWSAAVQATSERPLTGTGPGTFQRPYARLKSPEAEMARLVHNDYLEQFSDSGIPGGIAYLVWILAWMLRSGRRALAGADTLWFAVALGCTAWLCQGLTEFALYVPALAWTAFLLIGATSAAVEPTPSPIPHPRTAP